MELLVGIGNHMGLAKTPRWLMREEAQTLWSNVVPRRFSDETDAQAPSSVSLENHSIPTLNIRSGIAHVTSRHYNALRGLYHHGNNRGFLDSHIMCRFVHLAISNPELVFRWIIYKTECIFDFITFECHHWRVAFRFVCICI